MQFLDCSNFRLIGQFTPVLALYDPFGVDVPLNFDIIIINRQQSSKKNPGIVSRSPAPCETIASSLNRQQSSKTYPHMVSWSPTPLETISSSPNKQQSSKTSPRMMSQSPTPLRPLPLLSTCSTGNSLRRQTVTWCRSHQRPLRASPLLSTDNSLPTKTPSSPLLSTDNSLPTKCNCRSCDSNFCLFLLIVYCSLLFIVDLMVAVAAYVSLVAISYYHQ